MAARCVLAAVAALVCVAASTDADATAPVTADAPPVVVSAAPPPPLVVPTLRVLHPLNGSIVTVGSKLVLDMAAEGLPTEPPMDAVICIRIPTATISWNCFTDVSSLFIIINIERPDHLLEAVLINATAIPGLALAAAVDPLLIVNAVNAEPHRLLSSMPVTFGAAPYSACGGGALGRPDTKCSLIPAHCTSFTRFRFYLYAATSAPTRHAAEVYYALRDSPLRTGNPLEACVLINAASDPQVANMVTEGLFQASRRLTRLPYWGGNGENHLIFNFADYGAGFDTGRAMLARSSFGNPIDTSFYRPDDPGAVPNLVPQRQGYDVVTPMPFYRCNQGDFTHLHMFDEEESNGTIPLPANRTRLVSFKGAVYTTYPGHPSYVRHTLKQLHNGDDVVIALQCSAPSVSCEPCDPPACTEPKRTLSTTHTGPLCAAWTAEAESYAFKELLLNSKFAIVAPGEGTHSYRLYEALQAGAIPVLLGESAVPLEHTLPWSSFAVIQRDVSLGALTRLFNTLRTVDDAWLTRVQAVGRKVFNANFKTLEKQLHSTLAEITHVMKAQRTVLEKEAEAAEAAAQQRQQPEKEKEEPQQPQQVAAPTAAPVSAAKPVTAPLVQAGARTPVTAGAAPTNVVPASPAAAGAGDFLPLGRLVQRDAPAPAPAAAQPAASSAGAASSSAAAPAHAASGFTLTSTGSAGTAATGPASVRTTPIQPPTQQAAPPPAAAQAVPAPAAPAVTSGGAHAPGGRKTFVISSSDGVPGGRGAVGAAPVTASDRTVKVSVGSGAAERPAEPIVAIGKGGAPAAEVVTTRVGAGAGVHVSAGPAQPASSIAHHAASAAPPAAAPLLAVHIPSAVAPPAPPPPPPQQQVTHHQQPKAQAGPEMLRAMFGVGGTMTAADVIANGFLTSSTATSPAGAAAASASVNVMRQETPAERERRLQSIVSAHVDAFNRAAAANEGFGDALGSAVAAQLPHLVQVVNGAPTLVLEQAIGPLIRTNTTGPRALVEAMLDVVHAIDAQTNVGRRSTTSPAAASSAASAGGSLRHVLLTGDDAAEVRAAVTPVLSQAFYMLSQAYSLLGHWRHAATAATWMALQMTDSSGDIQPLILRARNAILDARRAPATGATPPLAMQPYSSALAGAWGPLEACLPGRSRHGSTGGQVVELASTPRTVVVVETSAGVQVSAGARAAGGTIRVGTADSRPWDVVDGEAKQALARHYTDRERNGVLYPPTNANATEDQGAAAPASSAQAVDECAAAVLADDAAALLPPPTYQAVSGIAVATPASGGVGHASPQLRHHVALRPQRLYRVTEDSRDSDSDVMRGYGALAHFMQPAPLAGIDAPMAALLPIALEAMPAMRQVAAAGPASAHAADGSPASGGASSAPIMMTLSSSGSVTGTSRQALPHKLLGDLNQHRTGTAQRAAEERLHAYVHGQRRGRTHADTVYPLVSADEETVQAVAAQLGSASAPASRLHVALADALAADAGGAAGAPASANTILFPNGYAPSAAGDSGDAVFASATHDETAHLSLGQLQQPQPSEAEVREARRRRIAIVSLCAYNTSATSLPAHSIPNLDSYCRRHGYSCYLSNEAQDSRRPLAWGKVPLVAQVLPHHEWVMWRDCDSFFMDQSVPVEEVLQAAMTARATIARATAQVALAKGWVQGDASGNATTRVPEALPLHMLGIGASAVDVIASEDGFMLNTGIFFLRNTPYTRSLVERAYGVIGTPASPIIPLEHYASFAAQGRTGPGGMRCTGTGSTNSSSSSSSSSNSGCMMKSYADTLALASAPGGVIPAPGIVSSVRFVAEEKVAAADAATRGMDSASAAAAAGNAATAAGQAAQQRMLASELPFKNNRAWEQATFFSEMAPLTDTSCRHAEEHRVARGAVAERALRGAAAAAAAEGDLLAGLPLASACIRETYAGTARVQLVPQRWLNSYPHKLAAAFHDHHGAPMHAPYTRGDWIVSFSGCNALLGAETCEGMFEQHARAAR